MMRSSLNQLPRRAGASFSFFLSLSHDTVPDDYRGLTAAPKQIQ
jgi:hypothetical protein